MKTDGIPAEMNQIGLLLHVVVCANLPLHGRGK